MRDFFVKETMGKPSSILDVGCSHGHFLASLKDGIEPKVSVDIVRVPLKDANEKFLNVVLADAHFLPFKDKAFELVTALEVLEHLIAPSDALREWMRVSSEGLIISSPVEDGHRTCNMVLYLVWCLRNAAIQRQSGNLSSLQNLNKAAGHISVMTRREILNLYSTKSHWKTEKCLFYLKTPFSIILDKAIFPEQLRKLVLRIEIAASRIPIELSRLVLFKGFAAIVKLQRTR